jgi:hypothetical protein
LSPPAREIFRRTNALFKNIDKLGGIAISADQRRGESGNGLEPVSIILKNLSEYDVRSMCGAVIYGAGLQDYIQGRFSVGRFRKNVLWGRVNESGKKWVPEGNLQVFEPMVTVEMNSNKHRISGDCACSFAGEGNLCPHMATLMIAWVRKPQEFEEGHDERALRSEFDDTRREVLGSLRELVDLIGEDTPKADVLWVLQRMYSKLAIWAGDVKTDDDRKGGESISMISDFSATVNSVAFAVMSRLERKYRIGAIDLYNKATVATLAKALELLVENSSSKKLVRQNTGSEKRKKRAFKRTTTTSPQVARSWDSLIENFSGR